MYSPKPSGHASNGDDYGTLPAPARLPPEEGASSLEKDGGARVPTDSPGQPQVPEGLGCSHCAGTYVGDKEWCPNPALLGSLQAVGPRAHSRCSPTWERKEPHQCVTPQAREMALKGARWPEPWTRTPHGAAPVSVLTHCPGHQEGGLPPSGGTMRQAAGPRLPVSVTAGRWNHPSAPQNVINLAFRTLRVSSLLVTPHLGKSV